MLHQGARSRVTKLVRFKRRGYIRHTFGPCVFLRMISEPPQCIRSKRWQVKPYFLLCVLREFLKNSFETKLTTQFEKCLTRVSGTGLRTTINFFSERIVNALTAPFQKMLRMPTRTCPRANNGHLQALTIFENKYKRSSVIFSCLRMQLQDVSMRFATFLEMPTRTCPR